MDTNIDAPRITRKQPKLRASCDRCGASKLKCDRGQPECERCISHGVPCFYGLSRKMGKPRRDKQQSQSGVTTTAGGLDRSGTGTGGTTSDGIAISDAAAGANEQSSAGVTVAVSDVSTTTTTITNWEREAVDDMGLDALAGLYRHDGHHQPPAGLSASFAPFDFIDWASLADHAKAHDNGPFSATGRYFGGPEIASPNIRSHSSIGSPTPQPAATPHNSSEASSLPSTAGSIRGGGHDCALEAYEILKTLSSLDRELGSGTPSCGLDHVLRLNRKASEELSRLLACPCVRSPHLSLLYVSVISRILDWYQQAASCTTAKQAGSPLSSWSSPPSCPSIMATAICKTKPEKETALASSLSSPGVSSHASTGGTTIIGPGSGPTSGTMTGIAPVKMAIGTFDVDDLGIQNAVKIQLLSGELRRAGRLIDQLTAHYSAASAASASSSRHPNGTDETGRLLLHGVGMYMNTNTSNLYHSLDSWLRGEHARITNMMRMILKELNT
ncbi:hypothetical protein N657DRAFT_647605 [Parathielavia appendiculata]|uniref:Zn(2)-C6 fungal-type domain-containing protein n=1 Tax=Parathielavia appendiculata TaxID=2587402 RepID=A0AAN6TWS0_9PEZI|nr:hypothetical protein N657DRAFT_647605 [Parathielavia appendiculata]